MRTLLIRFKKCDIYDLVLDTEFTFCLASIYFLEAGISTTKGDILLAVISAVEEIFCSDSEAEEVVAGAVKGAGGEICGVAEAGLFLPKAER